MADKKKKQILRRTPVVSSLFSHVVYPDDKFGKNVFSLTVRVDPSNAEHVDFIETLIKVAESELGAGAKIPVSDDKDRETKKPTGNKLVKFHSKFPPKIFGVDNKNVELEEEIPYGTPIRVAYRTSAYDGFGGGITLYLEGVRILEDTRNELSMFDDMDNDKTSLIETDDEIPF